MQFLSAAASGVVVLAFRPGQFVSRGRVLARFHGDTSVDEETLADDVNYCVVMGPRRTPRQDVECALLELVELAVRALSSGVNDPFTAVNVVDRLGAMLGRIGERRAPAVHHFDGDGALRVVLPAVTYRHLMDASFNQIRQHGHADTAVLIRMLEALNSIACRVDTDEVSQALRAHVEMILREGEASIREPNDRADLEEHGQVILDRLEAMAGPTAP